MSLAPGFIRGAGNTRYTIITACIQQASNSARLKLILMKHTDSRIWVHLIWTTKNRERTLYRDKGEQLFEFLLLKAKESNIAFEKLNIQPEHIHGLIDLPTDKTVADFMHLIKGSSSRWLNQHVFRSHFSWQSGYGAYSVSASQLNIVKTYIEKQSEHHKRFSFSEEYKRWKREYGFFDD